MNWLGRAVIAMAVLSTLLNGEASAEQRSWNMMSGGQGPAQPSGALSGATIFVSPGHGWYFNEGRQEWITQRGVTHGLIEDFSNAEAVLQYLVPYLWNAGAKVHTMRERDLQENMVIVEAGGAGHRESGEWKTQYSESAYGGDQRVAQTHWFKKRSTIDPEKIAQSIFTPNIPEDGYYGVYVWYSPSNEKATTEEAQFHIRHTGGNTVWKQDQSVDGRTWKYIGTYYFEKGSDFDNGSVTVVNLSPDKKKHVIADAVRFGGGLGDVADAMGVSGKPRWEESGYYYSQFMGYQPDADTRRFNTVSAMPLYSEWEAEPWEKGKSVYIGWHTNAFQGESRGLFSFIYGPESWGGEELFTGYPNGVELVHSVHNEIIHDVHTAYDPEWRDGGVVTRWLGETNPHYNNEMPAALFEMGFHDNVDDASYILDPQFRNLVARAVYQGIVKYYANNVDEFESDFLLPESPTHFAITSLPGNKVRLSWQEPPYGNNGVVGDRADSYRLFRSSNGKGFDNGVPLSGTELELSGFPTGETVYLRLTAENGGGRSLPSETLGIQINDRVKKVLIVNGFDRFDRGLNLIKDGVERGIISKMNTRDYVIQHADAVTAAGYAFDSSSNDAVVSRRVSLDDYPAVIWILGQESGSTEALNAAERYLITEYLNNGGALFISGSEAAADLSQSGEGADFLSNVLRAKLGSDDAGTSHVMSLESDSLFSGLSPFTLDDGSGRTYPVQSPDALQADGGSIGTLAYGDNGGTTYAGVYYDNEYRLVYLGFPFETINEESARHMLMQQALKFLLN